MGDLVSNSATIVALLGEETGTLEDLSVTADANVYLQAILNKGLEDLGLLSSASLIKTNRDSGPNVGKNKRRLLKLAQLRERVQREERDIETLIQLGAL